MTVRDTKNKILFTAKLTGEGIPLPPAPVITSFDPAAAEIGETVTIFGANLAGATAVLIGLLSTSFMVVDDTQIMADVSGPPRLAPITVVTPSGTAVSSASFRVIFVRPPRE